MKIFLSFTFNDKLKNKSYSYNIDDDGSKEVKDFLASAILKHNSSHSKDEDSYFNKLKEDIDLYNKKLIFKKDNEQVELNQLVKNVSTHSIIVDLDNNIYQDEEREKESKAKIEGEEKAQADNFKMENVEEKPKINKIKNYEIEQKEGGGICCCLKAFFKC